jgi:hypothetical protein
MTRRAARERGGDRLGSRCRRPPWCPLVRMPPAAALFGLVLAISGAGASSFSADISGSTFDRKPFPSCGVE